MGARQALEAAGADVFLDAATVRALLPKLETKDHMRCTFSGVVALSYAWVTPADPDPQRAQLQALRPVLVWWMCERARRKQGTKALGDKYGYELRACVDAYHDQASYIAAFGSVRDELSAVQFESALTVLADFLRDMAAGKTVIYDIETTELVNRAVPLERMSISCATVLVVDLSVPAPLEDPNALTLTFWNAEVSG